MYGMIAGEKHGVSGANGRIGQHMECNEVEHKTLISNPGIPVQRKKPKRLHEKHAKQEW